MYENLAILAAFVFLYSTIAGGIERTPFSGPIVFTLFGLILGPMGFGILTLDVDNNGLKILAELTLALVLFTDAASTRMKTLEHNYKIPLRLLFVGLPLTILLGFVVGILIFDELGMFEIAILATMLAPTDAALGKAVISNNAVPEKIRDSLNVESGLNDGLCVPVLFILLALVAVSKTEGGTLELVLITVVKEIGFGLVVGIGLTFIANKVLKVSAERGWLNNVWLQVPVGALAVACFALAEFLGGSGFIAAFTGGILFGSLNKQNKEKFTRTAEGTGDTLALLTWVIFGAMVVGQSFSYFNWQILLYAILSLTLVRILPVIVSLSAAGLSIKSKLFIGWFGPRGLASIVFGIIVLNEALPGGKTLSIAVVCTVILSIVAHGLSANPLSVKFFARKSIEK
jgi:NhaP-type Na+/H+ or K+/H+ antiporter